MFKTSQIISMPVISLFEGINVGTIKNFLFDKKQLKLKGFFIFDDETDVGENFIPSNKIFSMGQNGIVIKNLESIAPIGFVNQTEQIVGKQAMSLFGENLGKISDLLFDENFCVCSFETTEKIILPANKIFNIGRDVVFFSENNVKISNFKPKRKILTANLPDIKVSILNVSEPQTVPVIGNTFEEVDLLNKQKIGGAEKARISFPKKILSNPKSIIGKHANKTIYGLNGEIVVKDRQIITDKIYQKAQRHQKLFELTNSYEN